MTDGVYFLRQVPSHELGAAASPRRTHQPRVVSRAQEVAHSLTACQGLHGGTANVEHPCMWCGARRASDTPAADLLRFPPDLHQIGRDRVLAPARRHLEALPLVKAVQHNTAAAFRRAPMVLRCALSDQPGVLMLQSGWIPIQCTPYLGAACRHTAPQHAPTMPQKQKDTTEMEVPRTWTAGRRRRPGPWPRWPPAAACPRA